MAHADDLYVWLRDEADLERAKGHLRDYQRISGARINLAKSKIYSLEGDSGKIMKRPLVSEGTDPEPAEEEEEKGIRILGITFSLTKEGWKENWRSWTQRTLLRLDKWKRWRLPTVQKVRYFSTYCVPAGNYLAGVYPPPQDLMKDVMRKVVKWILGVLHFPLARVVTFRKHSHGGLGLLDVGLWFLCSFIATNWGTCRNAEEGHDPSQLNKQVWESFTRGWRRMKWGWEWW